jgi:hypothetical protein
MLARQVSMIRQHGLGPLALRSQDANPSANPHANVLCHASASLYAKAYLYAVAYIEGESQDRFPLCQGFRLYRADAKKRGRLNSEPPRKRRL